MTRPPSADLLDRLKALVGPDGWTDDPEVLAPRLVEWRGRWSGHTPFMLSPASMEETAAIVRLCAGEGAPLTVQGGNTGLVGGQIPQGEILLSTRRMRAIRDVDPVDDILVAEAGVTLAEVQAAAEAAGRRFPLSLASEGTATLGGVVSTNAGGVAVLRFGTARDLVLGLEAVLPNGEIWRGLRRLRKDNTGYDLRGLLTGAEGTLGVITAASVKLFPGLPAGLSPWWGWRVPPKRLTSCPAPGASPTRDWRPSSSWPGRGSTSPCATFPDRGIPCPGRRPGGCCSRSPLRIPTAPGV